jgi:hypothetical protein
VLVVTHHALPPGEVAGFRERCHVAREVLVSRSGCLGVVAGQALGAPAPRALSTSWESVGADRRALTSYRVRPVAAPLGSCAPDEPSAFESLLAWPPDTGPEEHRGAIAAEHDSGGTG